MSSVLVPIITIAGIYGFFASVKKSAKKDLENNTKQVLRFPWGITLVGLVCFLLFTFFTIYSNVKPNGTESILTTSIFIFFAVCGFILFLFSISKRITYNESEISYRSFLFITKKIQYSQITKITYNKGMQQFQVYTENGKKFIFDGYLTGWRMFSLMLLDKVDHEKIDFMAIEILKSIGNGVPVKML